MSHAGAKGHLARESEITRPKIKQRNVRNTNPVTIPPKKAFWNNLPSGTEEVRDEVPTVRYT